MTRVLFTSVFKPYGVDDQYNVSTAPVEFFKVNIGNEGIFTLRGVEPTYPLQLIAQNIESRSVVLDFPTKREFIKEIKSNFYDFICISFICISLEKVKEMIRLIKKYSPKSKIVLGGHGATIPGIESMADYVCKGEGVNFMRILLGENVGKPIAQDWRPFWNKHSFMGIKSGEDYMKARGVLISLGCSGGCEFCSTCYFYGKKKIYLLKTGKEIYDILKKRKEKYFNLYDENFLDNKKIVNSLGKFIKKNKDFFSMSCFCTPMSASNYSPEELLKMGITTVWFSVESNFVQYAKSKNTNLRKLTKKLRDNGIHVIVSFLIGYDFHTKDNLKEDIDAFLDIRADYHQFEISTPAPGTPFYYRLQKQDRLLNLPWKYYDGNFLLYKHPSLTKRYLEDIRRNVKKYEIGVLGPSIIRSIETEFRGYNKFKGSKIEILSKRAGLFENYCKVYRPFLYAARFFVKKRAKEQILRLLNAMEDEWGGIGIRQKAFSYYIVLKCFMIILREKFFGEIVIQPETMREEYNSS